MPTSVPIVFDKLMDSKYWEQLSKDDRRLSQWLMVAGIATSCPHDSLGEIIEYNELESDLLEPCQTIDTLFDEREDDDNFDEDESTHLAIFGEKEYDLRKQNQLTRSSLLDLAVWCIARLRENNDDEQEVMRSS